jgi:hypothetical protein
MISSAGRFSGLGFDIFLLIIYIFNVNSHLYKNIKLYIFVLIFYFIFLDFLNIINIQYKILMKESENDPYY